MLSGRWTCRRCFAANNPSDESCSSCRWPRVPGSAPLPETADPNAPAPSEAQPWAQPAPPPRPWWTNLLQFWWILIPIGVIGFGFFSEARRDDGGQLVDGGNLDVFDLSVGDCYDSSDQDEIAEVEAGPCTEPHEYEVFAIVSFPAQRGSDYPGDDAVFAHAETECLREFEEYVGIPYEDSVYDIGLLSPTESGWESGDRETICSGYDPGDSTLEESIRGIER